MWRAAATEPEPEHKTPHTTDTQDNFATVPEIMKELKCLVDAVLKPLWGVFFIYLTYEIGISDYKGMNSGWMNLG